MYGTVDYIYNVQQNVSKVQIPKLTSTVKYLKSKPYRDPVRDTFCPLQP
jgi:hypothetical protein